MRLLYSPTVMQAGLWLLASALFFAPNWLLPLDPVIGKGIGILSAVALLWLTEALHVTITALLIPILVSLSGLLTLPDALLHFANPVLFLFMGGFAWPPPCMPNSWIVTWPSR